MTPTPARKAVFPMAGIASRFLPASKALPKVMFPVLDTPVLQYAVAEARASGIEQLIFVIAGRGRRIIERHFTPDDELTDILRKRGADAAIAATESAVLEPGSAVFIQQDEPRGLGHAVLCARHAIGPEPFAVLLPDMLLLDEGAHLGDLVAAQAQYGGNVVGVGRVPHRDVSRYGIVDADVADARPAPIRGIVEKPSLDAAPSDLAVIGRYVLDPRVFAAIEAQPPGADGEMQLTGALVDEAGVLPAWALRYDGAFFDCGNRLGLFEANLAAGLANPELAPAMEAMLAEYGNRNPSR